MEADFGIIPSGGVTSPGGFRAGATIARIKAQAAPHLDLAILSSEVSCEAAAVFTTNKVKAAPVVLSRQRLQSGRVAAVVANSGCANACTGDEGLADATEMAGLAAGHLGVPPEAVVVASTGVIGTRLPMARVGDGIRQVVLKPEGGHDFALAIMTTDTVPKEVAVRAGDFVVGGVAKGAGMIHPSLATLLCFLTTDAAVESDFLKRALRQAVDTSFNMLSVDGDTSTNDMVLAMANGLAGNKPVRRGSHQAKIFQRALSQVCIHLAKMIARDGEGAEKFIEVKVSGAASVADARRAARTIVGSPLVKAAVHGSDPNWGRVVAAAGRSGAALQSEKIGLDINGIILLKNGRPVPFDERAVAGSMGGSDVTIALDLNLGGAAATAWGCDLSEEYVRINSQYTT